MVLDDDSSTDESGEESDVFYKGAVNHCAECDTHFKGRECQTAIGCDTPYCRRWFHVKCTGLKLMGKTQKQIEETEFICKYC